MVSDCGSASLLAAAGTADTNGALGCIGTAVTRWLDQLSIPDYEIT